MKRSFLLVATLSLLVGSINSSPFKKANTNNRRRQRSSSVWKQPEDNWNITTIPRSVHPHLENKNYTHSLPAPGHIIYRTIDSDERLLMRFHEIKNNASARTLWGKSDSSDHHYSPFFDKALKLLNLQQVAFEIENSVMSKMSCTACKAGASLLQNYIKSGKSKEEIIKTIFQYCVNLRIQSAQVCEGVSQLFGGEVIYVLKRTNLGADEICSFIIGEACGDIYNPYHEWEVELPPIPKPIAHELPIPKEGAPSFKVLHLSDTHYDPYYEPGANAECKEGILCCRHSSGRPTTPNAAAGKWGDYRKCDMPKRSLDHMYQHIASTHHDIDYILWTGDLPPHDIWNQTKEENLKILKETVKQMSEMFPGVPIFPALGNHESAPVNSFPPPYVKQVDSSIAWLYDALDIQWRKWLPASVSHTVRRGAFYSVLVRPGFRIISLNMNYCNNLNWWLLLNSTDPATELQWFIYELQSAEFLNEKVHVIGHIPPGHSDCLKVWSRNYYKIVQRYENTITAQFFGHTHFDEFEVFYDLEDISRATRYRIYYVDGDHDASTRLVIDHETWIMNLKEANLYDFPIYYKLYSARAAYNMKALRPNDWDELINTLTDDQDKFDLYYKNYWKVSPVRPACDADCRKRLLCDAKSGRSHDRKFFCAEVESKIDSSNNGWRSWIYKGISFSYVYLHE
ncbi:CLUMA_CG005448, isoform B [Clunio marinus]|uniref:Sphingomyelin phosphodiesterase n=1 Tax=Clunio marinus TaxID=568069 RepID=A0A1J1I0B1_9DIPT|nr:CLUMA_CG005448, isoform B [Clunio marinus]